MFLLALAAAPGWCAVGTAGPEDRVSKRVRFNLRPLKGLSPPPGCGLVAAEANFKRRVAGVARFCGRLPNSPKPCICIEFGVGAGAVGNRFGGVE